MKNIDVFVLFVLVRLLSVVIVQTWFVPDEYWQSLEVAHKLAFNYGYLTWEWVLGIRSYVQPLIISFVYKILQFCYADNALVLIYVPRILQALLSAYADYCFYKWCGTKKWAIFNISTAWFWFYCSSRTLINSLETALTIIALSKFPWDRKNSNESNFLWIVSTLCVIRPTAVIQWFPLCIYYIVITREKLLSIVFGKFVPIGVITLTASIILDSYAHGSIIVTSYEFLKANVLNNVGEWYGTYPWYWYLSSGLPALLGIQIIPFVAITINILRHRHEYQHDLALLGCIVFTLFVYSCLKHKEFRFILPLLPMVLKITSSHIAKWSYKAAPLTIWFVTTIMLVGNVVPALYFSLIHQRGTLDVMQPLRLIAEKNPHSANFLFLMPCHSTPFYSYLHINVTTRFLTCEPNLQNKKNYVCEADDFYNNPNLWLRHNYPENGTLPTHIIVYDSLTVYLSNILSMYKPIKKIFHTHFPSERIGKYIYIYQIT